MHFFWKSEPQLKESRVPVRRVLFKFPIHLTVCVSARNCNEASDHKCISINDQWHWYLSEHSRQNERVHMGFVIGKLPKSILKETSSSRIPKSYALEQHTRFVFIRTIDSSEHQWVSVQSSLTHFVGLCVFWVSKSSAFSFKLFIVMVLHATPGNRHSTRITHSNHWMQWMTRWP